MVTLTPLLLPTRLAGWQKMEVYLGVPSHVDPISVAAAGAVGSPGSKEGCAATGLDGAGNPVKTQVLRSGAWNVSPCHSPPRLGPAGACPGSPAAGHPPQPAQQPFLVHVLMGAHLPWQDGHTFGLVYTRFLDIFPATAS